MSSFKVLIVDDEPIPHKIIQDYCKEIDDLEIVGSRYDGSSAIKYLNSNHIDILFLDLHLPDMRGWEILKEIDPARMVVIFITAFDNYALQSFEYDQVIDYLHKPFRFSRFKQSIERAKKIIRTNRILESLEAQEVSDESLTEEKSYLTFNNGNKIISISYLEISYMQAWGNYIKIHLMDGHIEVIRRTFIVMENQIRVFNFLRVHKSFIVNIAFVTKLTGHGLKVQDYIIPIGKNYLTGVKKALNHLI
jgi:DNA-binding LytR/AlgR family response regulator